MNLEAHFWISDIGFFPVFPSSLSFCHFYRVQTQSKCCCRWHRLVAKGISLIPMSAMTMMICQIDRSECGDGHATTQSDSNMDEILNSGQPNQAKFNSILILLLLLLLSHHNIRIWIRILDLTKKNRRTHTLTKWHNQIARNGRRERKINEPTITTTRRQAQIRPNLINADNDNIFIYLSIFLFFQSRLSLYHTQSYFTFIHFFTSEKAIFGSCIFDLTSAVR